MTINWLLLLDRQGMFQGDLNVTQQLALAWIINQEATREIDLEKLRATNIALATNPATSRDFLMSMLEEEIEDEVQYVTDNKGWTTPSSVTEIEEFLKRNPL